MRTNAHEQLETLERNPNEDISESSSLVAVGAAFAAPAATSHATVSLLQPQGKALTAASVTYILRVPNEKAAQSTYSVIMTVPEAVQQSISVKQMADWTITLQRQRHRPEERSR